LTRLPRQPTTGVSQAEATSFSAGFHFRCWRLPVSMPKTTWPPKPIS
jgi:hypothetical protein